MPVGRRYDFTLNGKGYILARPEQGRAWQRSGIPDTPSRRSPTDAKYGELPDELDHPEVWDDWSGGYGLAYRRNGENRYHWAINFDARNPRQLVHVQGVQLAKTDFSIADASKYMLESVDGVYDSTLLNSDGGQGAGKLVIFGRHGWVTAIPTGTTVPAQPVFAADQVVSDLAGTSASLHRAVTYGSYIYLGQSNPSGFYGITATGFLGLSANLPGFRFGLAGNQLWRAHGPDANHAIYLQNCGNPDGVLSLGSWGATYNIGNIQSPIKDLIALDGQIFAGKNEGLYAGDSSGTFVNVLAELDGQVHPDNCRDLTIWQNNVIVQHITGVYAYQPDAFTSKVENISPPITDRSSLRGRIRAVMGYGKYLYAGLYSGSASWLLCGERQGDRMAWHPLQQFPHFTKISRLRIDGITTASSGKIICNRFWAVTDASVDTSGTAPLYYWHIPTLDGNPLYASSTFTPHYVYTARIDLGNVDFGAPSTTKVFRSVEIWADNLTGPDRYCEIYYNVDNSGSFTLLGSGNTSPKSTLFFPASDGSYVTGQSIELSLRSYAEAVVINQRLVSPVYKAIVLRAALRPGNAEQITAQIRLGDNMRDRQGATMRSAATMIKELRALATRSTPVTLIDLAGATSYVNVLPPVEETEYYQKGDDNPELMAKIRMAIMTFS